MLLVAACAASCTEPQSVPFDSVDTAWVTADVRSHLDGRGQFVLPMPVDGTLPEISEAQARLQAAAWLKTFGSLQEAQYTERRGAPVSVSRLGPCARLVYARRAYKELDAVHPLFARRPFGPAWLVGLCDEDGAQVLLLSVSAYNTDVGIEDGFIRLAPISGGEFKSEAVPVSVLNLPPSPELAVKMAFEATGIRIMKVPELHMPPRPAPAYEARWKIDLENAVLVTLDDGTTAATQVLWIGSDGTRQHVTIATAGSPIASEQLHYTVLAPDGSVARDTTISIEGRPERGRWHTLTALTPSGSLRR